MPATLTVGMAQAKRDLSKLTANANQTGYSFVIFKNNKPWAEVRPLAHEADAVPVDTRQAMDEVEAIMADPDHITYKTAESVFSALGI